MKKIINRLFSSLWFLGLATILIFPLLAWPILWWQGTPFWSIFKIYPKDFITLPAFTAFGILFALVIIWFTEHPFFEKSMSRYKNLLSQFDLKIGQAIFLSICAGLGEEIFFRGAVQPLLGVSITAFLFVAIHGYFDFRNWKINLFALGLTCFIALIGWGAAHLSLWHAILPHVSYDLVLMVYVVRRKS